MVNQVIAHSLEEALERLHMRTYQVFAGGTDLMVQHRAWSETPIAFRKNIVYINHIKELDYIKESETMIEIGATTTLETLLHHPLTPLVMKRIFSEMASPAIRHTATLSGNIGNASPAGDSLVGLYLLDATICLQNLNGIRTLPIQELITGPRQLVMKPEEMIVQIRIPKTSFDRFTFVKVGGRRADAISKLSFLGGVKSRAGIIEDIRFAFGAVYKTVVRSKEIEQKWLNKSMTEIKNRVDDIVLEYAPLIQPIDDQRSNQIYRKQVSLQLLRDFILSQ